MDKSYLGGFIIGLSLAYGFCSFIIMFVIYNSNLHDQIMYGMLPMVISVLIGVSIHIFNVIQYDKRQRLTEVAEQ